MAAKSTFSEKDFRSYIKIRTALGKTAVDILEELRTVSPSTAPSRATVFRWAKHFSTGQTSVEDARGKVKKPPVTDNKMVSHVQRLVDEDPRVSSHFIAETLDISSSSVLRILKHKLGYTKVCARWVPHFLTEENKGCRVTFAQRLLKIYDGCDQKRLDEIETGDETWVYFFEPKRKAQNKAWIKKSANAPRIVRKSRSTKKVLYTIFFNTKGVIFQKPREKGGTITGVYYNEKVLADIVSYYKRARPTTGLKGIKLLHDNAPAHKSKVVKEYLEEENFETLPHPPYSLDLAPCDFFLFPHLKRQLAGRRFDSRSALGSAVFQCLHQVPKNDFKRSFLDWVQRLKLCVAAKGAYFEGLK